MHRLDTARLEDRYYCLQVADTPGPTIKKESKDTLVGRCEVSIVLPRIVSVHRLDTVRLEHRYCCFRGSVVSDPAMGSNVESVERCSSTCPVLFQCAGNALYTVIAKLIIGEI